MTSGSTSSPGPAGEIQWHSDTPSAVALVAGGAGGNSASWLAGRGADVTLLARVGRDAAGDDLPQRARGRGGALRLRRRRRRCRRAWSSSCSTRTATGRCSPTAGPTRPSPWPTSTLASLGLPAEPLPHLHLSGYVLFDAGSRAAGLEALRQARALGLDDVGRPAVAGAHRARGRRHLPVVGRRRRPAAAQRERGRDPRWARRRSCATPGRSSRPTVRPGRGGSRTTSTSRPRRPHVANVDATGCGDAFNAGLLAAWLARRGAGRGPAPPGSRPAAQRQPASAPDPADRHTALGRADRNDRPECWADGRERRLRTRSFRPLDPCG